MPTFKPERLTQITNDLLLAVGSSESHAKTVSEHLTNANLAGHDSHGFIRIIQYVREINEGDINPTAEPAVVNETSTTAQLDGKSTFGQVAMTAALEVGMAKAHEHGLGLVNVSNHEHTGRVGTYAETAAEEGMASFMCSGYVGGPNLMSVAPFGGTMRKLSTNPLVIAFPYNDDGPVLLDFATTVSAEGKLRVARAKGATLPDYWTITADGTPSNDPNTYYEGGSLLPIGGLHGGHKGYALSFMVTLFGAVLAAVATPEMQNTRVASDTMLYGSTMILIDLHRFGSLELIKAQVDGIVSYVKDTPLREGFSEVLYPGEYEIRNRQQRRIDGLYIEDATWDGVAELMAQYGVE
ncbi:MAG: Ldh family oxidoreductase [Chloroflexi bacterium]|nr:Ldh family oxidoreductase [Chloroflexota bacterium]